MLNNSSNEPNETYYLSSINDGKEEKIAFKVRTKGFVKNRIITAVNTMINPETNQEQDVANYLRFNDNTISDESETIRYEIASLFNIEIPQVLKIYNEENVKGILFKCNLRRNDIISTLNPDFSNLNLVVQNGQFKNSFKEYNIPVNTTGNTITTKEELDLIIKKGLNVLEGKTTEDKEKIRTEYIRMILLDLMLNQITRNGNDYYYYIESKNTALDIEQRTVKIIPGILNYRFITNEYQENEYCLNGFVVDRNVLLEVLFSDYYKYIRDVVKPLREVSDRYKECISRIIYSNTSKENAEYLERLYFEKIDSICELEKNKVDEGNKVELVSTTTQLNLTIQQKEEEIFAKYPKNIKDEYEDPLLDTDDRLSLKAEISKPDRKNGYVSAILVSTAIAFVCGLGMGIAYIILNLS